MCSLIFKILSMNFPSKSGCCAIFLAMLAINMFFSGCKKNDNVPVISKEPTVENLTQNSSFIKFVDILDVLEQHINESNYATNITKAQAKQYLQNPNEANISELARYFHFASKDDFLNVFKEQKNIVITLKSEFRDITFVSTEDWGKAISNVRENRKSIAYKLNMENPDDLCKKQYDACMKQSSSNYTKDVVACFAGAVGIGSVTIALGGVIFEIACGYAAYDALKDARELCNVNYQLCLKNQ